MNYVELSKEISYALRHAPWEYELELDEEGFVPVAQLLDAINEGSNYSRPVTLDDVFHIIDTSEKQRHEIKGDCIRALYGHTIPGRILKEEDVPPSMLYHGTSREASLQILTEGLKPMGRQYAHMSIDAATARRVGSRRDPSPVILAIDASRALADGIKFYRGNEKVWLADSVPAQYIRKATAAEPPKG